MKIIFVYLLFFAGLLVILPKVISASIGVGVNTGKIQVDEKLRAGMIYKLPSITVINTGDETSEYGVSISFHQDQPEIRPQASWFTFSPEKFQLEPGKAQAVEITLNLPLKVAPGNYFAYLEGHPLASVQKGGTTLGVAAAAKLYFTVEPANLFLAAFYKVSTFLAFYAPWPQRLLALFTGILILVLVKKNFNIQVNLRKKPSSSPKDNE